MKYSNLLNLGEILRDVPTYVVMRRSPDFPNYYTGQDVDLLVANMGEMIEHLTGILSDDSYSQYKISNTHIQIDHWNDGLDLKFDLFDYHISSALTNEILATRTIFSIEGYHFSVPQPMMDNILKCYEYLRNKKGKYASYSKYEPLLNQYEI